ncbi:MAG: DUF6446 family protein [Paracoccaceae bacterium]
MNGKLISGFIVMIAIVAGAALYYLQVYAFYEPVAFRPGDTIDLVPITGGAPEPMLVEHFEGIDADSSPLRFRGCFTTPMSLAMLTETFEVYDGADPLTGPGWFSCYDAGAIGAALQTGEAVAFLSQRDIAPGVDRVVAVYPDGRAFAWHQLNETFKD